jgi:hypothetical protein
MSVFCISQALESQAMEVIRPAYTRLYNEVDKYEQLEDAYILAQLKEMPLIDMLQVICAASLYFSYTPSSLICTLY